MPVGWTYHLEHNVVAFCFLKSYMSENLLMMIEKQILVKIDLSVKYYFTNRELDLSHFTFLTKHFPTNKSDIEHSILKFSQMSTCIGGPSVDNCPGNKTCTYLGIKV